MRLNPNMRNSFFMLHFGIFPIEEMEARVSIKYCPLCQSDQTVFETVLEKYPMGNIYLDSPEHEEEFLKNIKISQCTCGHLYAVSDFSADAIYNFSYTYLGDSTIPSLRREHGLEIILENLSGVKFNNLIDIGCGNFELIKYFMKNLEISAQKIGIDPVPRESECNDVLFINTFFENSDLNLESAEKIPNLICLDNVLEHIENLTDFFEKFVEFTHVGDYVYVCVPSFELMMQGRNFEEISHEHLQYFSLNAMNDLFSKFEFKVIKSYGKYIGTRGYNFHLFQFKGYLDQLSQYSQRNSYGGRGHETEKNFEEEFRSFRESLSRPLTGSVGKTWGVCASEITPALSYFMDTNLDLLGGIFDTTLSKSSKFMPGVAPQVLPWENLSLIPKDSTLFITVPQLTPIVLPKLKSLGFTIVSYADKYLS